MHRKITLVIVDFQHDFANLYGSMYVNGAEEAENKILHCIDVMSDEINEVIFTLDWHIPTHPSFSVNGGPWPRHCVGYTIGASLSDKLLSSAWNLGFDCNFFTKGENEEEYGAFSVVEKREGCVFARNHEGSCEIELNTERLYVVCGLALDYCVKETAKNLKMSGFDVAVYLDGTASIGSKDDAVKELEGIGIEVI